MMKTAMQELYIAILNTLACSLHHYENNNERFQEEVSLGMAFWKTKEGLKNWVGRNEKCLGLDGCCNGKCDTMFKVSSHCFPRGV